MSAELAYEIRPAGRARARLRVAPPPRRSRSSSRREVAYAITLGLILGLGVLGVLVLNTLMQQQARTIAAQQAALGALALRQQTLQLKLDETDNPRALARRAHALHMRPAGMLAPLHPAPPVTKAASKKAAKKVSARAPGTRPAHAG